MNNADGRYMARSRTYISSRQALEAGIKIHPAGAVLIPKRGGAIHTNKKRIMASAGSYDLNTMGIIPSDVLNPVFLWYWFGQIDLSELADGSNVPQINNPHLVDLEIPVPEMKEQEYIVNYLDEWMRGISRLESAASGSWPAMLRKSLLKEAFSGRLVPQDPTDEPVFELLARIGAERAVQAKPKRARRTAPKEPPTALRTEWPDAGRTPVNYEQEELL